MFALKKTAVALDRCNEAVLFIVALLFVMLLRLREHFPYNPLYPEAYSLPVKCLSNSHLVCKTLIYQLAFYFLTKLIKKNQTHVFLYKLHFIISIRCNFCKKQAELSQDVLNQGQTKLTFICKTFV